MVMKRALIYVLCTCLAVLGSVASLSYQEKRARSPGAAGNPVNTAANIVQITDPVEIERLWSKYIYDGIITIYNTEFSGPAELENKESYLVEYALMRLVSDGDIGSRPSGIKDLRKIDLPGAEQVQSKIKQYFNVDLRLDIDEELKETHGISDEDKTININVGQVPYNAPNPWGIVLRSITCDTTRSEYNIILDTMANSKTGRVERTTYIAMKERADRSLYFLSLKKEYHETRLVEIAGDYLTLKPGDFGVEMSTDSEPAMVIGYDTGGKLLVQADRFSDSNDPYSDVVRTLSIYDPAANRVEQQIELRQTKNSFLRAVRVLPDRLIFEMNDSFFTTGLDLRRTSDSIVSLPDVVKKALTDKDYTGAYDVSADLKRIAYTDKNGLYLYDLNNQAIKKLSSHIPVEGSLSAKAYIIAPYFSADDEAVISMLSGYENDYGVIAVSLEDPCNIYVRRNGSCFVLDNLDNAKGMYMVPSDESTGNAPATDVELAAQPQPFGIRMVDLEALSKSLIEEKQEISKVTFDDAQNQKPIDSIANIPFYNGKYLAYVAARYESGSPPEEQKYQIVRINLENMKTETVLSIKAGVPYISAVTNDGRVMFSYNFEREHGLAITGK